MITAIAAIASVSLSVAPTTQPSEPDVRLIARVVYAEAAGEPYAGKVAVASVVYNRVRTPGFPKTVRAVVYQRNAFSCVTGDGSRLWRASQFPDLMLYGERAVYDECVRAARQAATQPSTPAIAYRVTTCKGGASYFDRLTPCGVIGRHTFYVDKRP